MNTYKDLVSYMMPPGVLDYFDIIDVQEEDGMLYIWLDEYNKVPSHVHGKEIISNGLLPARKILDFPLRDRAVCLQVRCRRWICKETKEEIKRDWTIWADGSKYTKEFADFLKAVD